MKMRLKLTLRQFAKELPAARPWDWLDRDQKADLIVDLISDIFELVEEENLSDVDISARVLARLSAKGCDLVE